MFAGSPLMKFWAFWWLLTSSKETLKNPATGAGIRYKLADPGAEGRGDGAAGKLFSRRNTPTAQFVPVEMVSEAPEGNGAAGIMVIELPGERRVRVDRHVDAEALRRVLLALGVDR